MTPFGDVVLYFADAEVATLAAAFTDTVVQDIARACEQEPHFRQVCVRVCARVCCVCFVCVVCLCVPV
jgi:energy-converting hydrogenase Eha subunit H